MGEAIEDRNKARNGSSEMNSNDFGEDRQRSPQNEHADPEEEEDTTSDDDDPSKKSISNKYNESSVSASVVDENNKLALSSFVQRRAVAMAASPCTYFWVALIVSLTLSIVGMVGGGFSIAVDNAGWVSRGTLIADRQTQLMLIQFNRVVLWLDDDGSAWDNLIRNVQSGWEKEADGILYEEEERRRRRRLRQMKTSFSVERGYSSTEQHRRRLPFEWTPKLQRKLQASAGNSSNILKGCNARLYFSETLTEDPLLWPVWRINHESPPASLLDAERIREICRAEESTQATLISKGLCYGCRDTSRCLAPYSIVLYARLVVPDGFILDCDGLAEAWDMYFTSDIQQQLMQCANDLKSSFDPTRDSQFPPSCPNEFSPSLVDQLFDETSLVRYSSSMFFSTGDVTALFENVDDYNRGSGGIQGAYDTQYEDFVRTQVDNSVINDMVLAVGSAVITFSAIVVHTRSPFLSVIGLVQIVLSFPLAYFVYTFLGQLEFFPFLNFIGVFVVFALGADDIFVAVDKWKNARLKLGTLVDTTEIAAEALPDAAGAMFLTTLTTAVAFFATALSPVAPIRCFAIFCGLLIIFDYIMCVLLIFPALAIYDRSRDSVNWCMRCHCCAKATEAATHENSQHVVIEDKPSLIRRILSIFYVFLHKTRWFLLLVIAAALTLSAVYASKITLPTSSDVRLLDPDKYQYEARYEWDLNLLSTVLLKKGGSTAYIIFGTTPADTGDHNNPQSWSQLVLDDTFEPSGEESQIYLRDFCDALFATEWAEPIVDDYVCPINAFDTWLQEQANSTSPDKVYTDHCGRASGLPVSSELFDSCIYNWGQQIGETNVLARKGKVEVIYLPFKSRVRYDSPFKQLKREWRDMEDWMDDMNQQAPAGVSGGYCSSVDFWWMDTNSQMLNAAFTAAAIAVATGAVVILFSSRSLILTLFSAVAIAFVLASVTATLVALGWTLGFLESICFAILIGVSSDFVIHFSHAYSLLPGSVNRGERTKHALIQMGPSILAAAFTTIAAATIMLFTVISFFVKFAVVLFLTILMATSGSFIVFLTLADCFGPAEPTYVMDRLSQKFASCCNRRQDDDTEDADEKISSSGSTFKFEI